MNQEDKNELLYGARLLIEAGLIGGALEQLFTIAQKDGRESVLKAAKELLGTAPFHERNALELVNRDRQATDTIKALSDWCDLDQVNNRYDVGKTSLESDFKRYKVTLWNTPNHGGEAHTYIFGSTMLDVMAKAAQWCLLEIDNARRSGK